MTKQGSQSLLRASNTILRLPLCLETGKNFVNTCTNLKLHFVDAAICKWMWEMWFSTHDAYSPCLNFNLYKALHSLYDSTRG